VQPQAHGRSRKREREAPPPDTSPRVLILAPTRELVLQIGEQVGLKGGTYTPFPVPTGSADVMILPSSAHADMMTLPKVDTVYTAPSLIPTVNGNTVRSFSTHGQQSAAKGSSTTLSLTSD
jgi:hypothetical protein